MRIILNGIRYFPKIRRVLTRRGTYGRTVRVCTSCYGTSGTGTVKSFRWGEHFRFLHIEFVGAKNQCTVLPVGTRSQLDIKCLTMFTSNIISLSVFEYCICHSFSNWKGSFRTTILYNSRFLRISSTNFIDILVRKSMEQKRLFCCRTFGRNRIWLSYRAHSAFTFYFFSEKCLFVFLSFPLRCC